MSNEVRRRSRRAFFKQVLAAGAVGHVIGGWQAQAQDRVPPKPPENARVRWRRVLRQADFRYAGYWDVDGNLNGTDTEWGQGFTHRYVNGQLRFLTFGYQQGQKLLEFAPPASLGGLVNTVTGRWNDPWGNGYWTGGKLIGLWWDAERSRLWTNCAIDYPNDAEAMYTQAIHTRRLNADGTVSGLRGPWGLQGIGARRVYGGACRVPEWFRTTYGTGPFLVGWGGYTSRMAQGLGASLGPTAYAIPEPEDLADGSDVPSSGFKVLSDCGSGTSTGDWYRSGAPSSFDRGVRNSDVKNEYDGGSWLSPSPDGVGRWTWGDSAYNTGCWIEVGGAHGFVLVPSFSSGRAWYQNSTLNCERRTFEMQVYDPDDLGAASRGNRPSWNVKPASRWSLSLAGLGEGRTGNGPTGNVGGASFDPVTNRLYVYGIWLTPGDFNRIYVYDVVP